MYRSLFAAYCVVCTCTVIAGEAGAARESPYVVNLNEGSSYSLSCVVPNKKNHDTEKLVWTSSSVHELFTYLFLEVYGVLAVERRVIASLVARTQPAFKADMLINDTHTDFRLVLQNITSNEDAMYRCIDGNDWTAESYVVNVFGAPKNVSTTPDSNGIIFATAGSNVSLVCMGKGKPMPTYQWFDKSGAEMHTVNGSTTFVATRDHEGSHRCRASNNMGQVDIDVNFALLYTSPTRTKARMQTAYNRTAVMFCTADGAPLPKVEWYRNNVVLRSTELIDIQSSPTGNSTMSTMLLIHKVTESDLGIYTCLASSVVGAYNSTTLLTDRPYKVNVTITAVYGTEVEWEMSAYSLVDTDFIVTIKDKEDNERVKTVPAQWARGALPVASDAANDLEAQRLENKYTLTGLAVMTTYKVHVEAKKRHPAEEKSDMQPAVIGSSEGDEMATFEFSTKEDSAVRPSTAVVEAAPTLLPLHSKLGGAPYSPRRQVGSKAPSAIMRQTSFVPVVATTSLVLLLDYVARKSKAV